MWVEAQDTWPQRAKPSKIHLLRVRADNTCPIAHIPRAGCSAPRRRSPQSWVQHLRSPDHPRRPDPRGPESWPHVSWPWPSSWSHRGAGVGAGLGDWWPLVRSSGVEWGPHLHRTREQLSSMKADPWGALLHWVMGLFHIRCLCANRRESLGPPGLGKSWPPSPSPETRQGPPQVGSPGPALLRPRLPPMGYGLARGWVRFARRPHPESSEDELAAHHPCHVEQEEGVVGSLGPAPP